ncbi:unnamed protein product [Schistocephalus solidus]|uniref:Reverse transcriptase domain-containing protein n=1 Tax=Schistocephalus solidus TaxID=70667 RepID=A0A183SBB2_SCHSO|nr:unnamed protein product [Schistocephalus solidus]
MIMGEFNAPNVDWNLSSAPGSELNFDRRLLEAIHKRFLTTQRLLNKLNRIGVSGKLLKWIESFLIGRSQIVRLGDQQSAEVVVEIGIPRGSVLGPILFLIYINDCVTGLDCYTAMFADDIKHWKVIHNAADEETLQANLHRLEEWSHNWLLPFNCQRAFRI